MLTPMPHRATLTLSQLRDLLPAGATSEHMAHAAWLATDDAWAVCSGEWASTSLYRWADEHPSMSTLMVTWTYPEESQSDSYETL